MGAFKGKEYYICETFFYINLIVTKHTHKPKLRQMILKKEEVERKNMEYQQTKTTDRNTKEKNQWRQRATRKQ